MSSLEQQFNAFVNAVMAGKRVKSQNKETKALEAKVTQNLASKKLKDTLMMADLKKNNPNIVFPSDKPPTFTKQQLDEFEQRMQGNPLFVDPKKPKKNFPKMGPGDYY